MRVLVLFLSLGAFAALAQVASTHEVLVLNSAPTQIPRNLAAAGIEIYNNGPNTIWCGLVSSAAAVSGKARPIKPGASWAVNSQGTAIWCIADVADQVTGAATITSEAR